jgi:chromosomal replication initiation ATPase DnaA
MYNRDNIITMNIFEQQTQCGCNKRDCYFCWLKNRVYTTTALEGGVSFGRKSEPELEDILRAVSEASGVSVEDIKGECRRAEIRTARQIYCYLAKRAGRWSYAAIAKSIDKKKHATVMHSCKVVNEMLQTKNRSYERILIKSCDASSCDKIILQD